MPVTRDRRSQNLSRNRVDNRIQLQIQRPTFVPGFALCLRLSPISFLQMHHVTLAVEPKEAG